MPFKAIQQDTKRYIENKYLPANLVIKEPKNMQIDDIILFMEHVRERQIKFGPEDSFRFRIYIKKQQEHLSKYPSKVKSTRRNRKKINQINDQNDIRDSNIDPVIYEIDAQMRATRENDVLNAVGGPSTIPAAAPGSYHPLSRNSSTERLLQNTVGGPSDANCPLNNDVPVTCNGSAAAGLAAATPGSYHPLSRNSSTEGLLQNTVGRPSDANCPLNNDVTVTCNSSAAAGLAAADSGPTIPSSSSQRKSPGKNCKGKGKKKRMTRQSVTLAIDESKRYHLRSGKKRL